MIRKQEFFLQNTSGFSYMCFEQAVCDDALHVQY